MTETRKPRAAATQSRKAATPAPRKSATQSRRAATQSGKAATPVPRKAAAAASATGRSTARLDPRGEAESRDTAKARTTKTAATKTAATKTAGTTAARAAGTTKAASTTRAAGTTAEVGSRGKATGSAKSTGSAHARPAVKARPDGRRPAQAPVMTEPPAPNGTAPRRGAYQESQYGHALNGHPYRGDVPEPASKAQPASKAARIAPPVSAAQQASKPDVWDERVADFLGFVRRRITGQYEVDEFGFDPELTSALVHPALRLLYRHYFRVETTGVENLPDGAALVVANHSGTLPVDALMLTMAVHDETPAHRHLRLLGADLVFRLPFVSEVARKSGSTLACNADAERMLRKGEYVGVFPEGFKGIGKPYRERYKLQRFGRGGFVSAALRTGTPIVPAAIVGAEEIYPIIGNVRPLARVTGLPYVPVTPLFPWLGPLGMLPLPSKWLIEFGEPIETASLADEADDPIVVFNLADQVRETIQHTLHRLLERRPDPFS